MLDSFAASLMKRSLSAVKRDCFEVCVLVAAPARRVKMKP